MGEGAPAGGAGGIPPGQHVIRLSQEESQAIERVNFL